MELDLADNVLTAIPVAALSELPALMRLSLARNPLRRVDSGSFGTLKYLSTLEMSHCQIETVDEGAFDGLLQLEWLKLDGNVLKHLGGSTVLPRSLHGVSLHDNPWGCDCRLAQLRAWLVMQLNTPLSLEPQCTTPQRLAGRTIKSLEPVDLACAPEITPTSVTLDVLYGANISLQCRVAGEPTPQLAWWRNGHIMTLFTNESDASAFTISGPTLGIDGRQYSELSIINVTEKENGTFTCTAHNRAGSASSNFSVSVIPVGTVAPTATSIEYVFTVGGVVAAIVLTLVIIVVAVAVRCCCCRPRGPSMANRDDKNTQGNGMDKVIHLQSSQLSSQPTQMNGLNGLNGLNGIGALNGVNGMIPASMLIKTSHNGYGHHVTVPGLSGPRGEYQTPAVEMIDQSPDLISDTTALKWKESGGAPLCLVDGLYPATLYNNGVPAESYYPCAVSTISDTIVQQPQYYSPLVPSSTTSEMVVLNPANYLDPDGFPIDYGLPRPGRPTRPFQSHVRFADPPSSVRHYENFASSTDTAAAHPDPFLADRKYPDDYGHIPSAGEQDYPQIFPPEAYANADQLAIESATSQHLATLATLAALNDSAVPMTAPSTLQRQPHESPDEGYEDEGADGTEI